MIPEREVGVAFGEGVEGYAEGRHALVEVEQGVDGEDEDAAYGLRHWQHRMAVERQRRNGPNDGVNLEQEEEEQQEEEPGRMMTTTMMMMVMMKMMIMIMMMMIKKKVERE